MDPTALEMQQFLIKMKISGWPALEPLVLI